MLLGWRPQQKSAQGPRKRQNRQGEVSQADANGNTTYGALLAFPQPSCSQVQKEGCDALSRA
jgi:hypothetical protein